MAALTTVKLLPQIETTSRSSASVKVKRERKEDTIDGSDSQKKAPQAINQGRLYAREGISSQLHTQACTVTRTPRHFLRRPEHELRPLRG